MRTYRHSSLAWWTSLAFLAAAVGVASAAPLRMALPAPPTTTLGLGRLDDATRLEIGLAQVLAERLGQCPGVALASPAWGGAALAAARSAALRTTPADILPRVQADLPVDAVLWWQWRDGQLTVYLAQTAGVQQQVLACPAGTPLAQVLPQVAPWLAQQLALSLADAARLRGTPPPDPQLLDACAVAHQLGAEWVSNAGEARLAQLRPYLRHLATSPELVAAVLDGGAELSRDHRALEHENAALTTVLQALPLAFGTPREADALTFLRVNRHASAQVLAEVLALVRPLGQDEADQLLEGAPAPALAPGLEAGPPVTLAQRVGALRALAVLHPPAALPLLARTARHTDSSVRAATAVALGGYSAPAGAETLTLLAGDAQSAVAFAAAVATWRRGQPPTDLLTRARAQMADPALGAEALAAVAALGDASDVDRLRAAATRADADARLIAAGGLLRLHAAPADMLQQWLATPDADLVREVLPAVPPDALPALRPAVVHLANSSYRPVAEAARQALAAALPAAPTARWEQELATEHPYVRQQLVARLAAEAAPWAMDALAGATHNADPYVRAAAFGQLAVRAPARAQSALPALLADPALWVRLHASALAATLATPALAPPLRQALAATTDPVERLALTRALAAAEGRPAPPLPAAANRLDPTHNHPALCGFGADVEGSPFQLYYCLNQPQGAELQAAARRAHAAGKLFLVRANTTAKNPGQVLFDPDWRDAAWLNLMREFASTDWCDGIILGEESMYARPNELWPSTWRLFCRDAGLDTGRIAGDRTRLTATEQAAWLAWEQERAVDGFNVLHDFIKLYFGQLRPGFLVGTFMPDQNGSSMADRRWRFDVVGAYNYYANNRLRYNLIRRCKTLWPERPVLWLSDGNLMTGNDAPVKYDAKVPAALVGERSTRAYADSVAAWLAGADTGFFNAWLFVAHDSRGGPNASGTWLFTEDIAPASPTLQAALDTAFRGVAARYRTAADIAGAPAGTGKVTANTDPDLALDDPASKPDPYAERVARERAALRQGFLLGQQRLYDIARVLSDLPRPEPAHQVLFVGPRGGVPQLELASDYDYLELLNQVADQPLATYRLIGLAGQDQTSLTDGTIATLTAWLRTTPGVLYVRGTVTDDAAREAATPTDLDGRLTATWPWVTDLPLAAGQYQPASAAVRELVPGLLAWQGAGYQGVALFDRTGLAPADLRAALLTLAAERHLTLALDGPLGRVTGSAGGVSGVATLTQAPAPLTVPGLELLTGEANPVVTVGRSAALTSTAYTGRYVAIVPGLAVLGEQPLSAVTPLPAGLRVTCAGRLQVAASGPLTVVADGPAPPTLTEAAAITRWLAEERTPGRATLNLPGFARPLTWVRATAPLTLSTLAPANH